MSSSVSSRKRALSHDQLSALIVTGITIVAVLLGWGLKTTIENRSRPVQESGVTAEVPDGWLVHYGAGDLVFLARNPQFLKQQYRVTLLDATGNLVAMADQQNYQRVQLTSGYQVLDETSVVIDGRDAYKVSYAYVDTEVAGMPTVLEGADYYFQAGEGALVISLEASAERFADSLPRFFRFMKSVSYQGSE